MLGKANRFIWISAGLSAYAVLRVAGLWLGYGLTPEGSLVW
jgi:hypothetical protein